MVGKYILKSSLYLLTTSILFPVRLLGQITTSEVFLAVSIFVLILHTNFKLTVPNRSEPIKLILIYCSLSLASLFIVEISSYRSIGYIINILIGILFSIVIFSYFKVLKFDSFKLLRFVMIISVIGSILTIIEFTFFPAYDVHGNLRAGGGKLHGPSFGALASIGSVLCLKLFIDTSFKNYKLFYFIVFTINILGTFLTNTRTWLLTLFILSLYVIQRTNKFTRYVLVPAALILFITVIPNYQTGVLPHEVIGSLGRYQLLLNFDLYDSNPRYHKWSLALDQFQDHIFLGAGAFNLDLSQIKGTQFGGIRQSDSFFIDTLAYDGILGFIIFNSALIIMFLRLRKIGNTNYRDFGFVILFTWIIGGLFWNFMITYSVFIFFLFVSVIMMLIENNDQ